MIHPRVLPSRCTRRLSLINSVMALKKDLDLSIHLITTFFEVHHMSRAANYNVSFQKNVSKCLVQPVDKLRRSRIRESRGQYQVSYRARLSMKCTSSSSPRYSQR